MKRVFGWAAVIAVMACFAWACSEDGVDNDEPEVRLVLQMDTVDLKQGEAFDFYSRFVEIHDGRRLPEGETGAELTLRYEVADEEVAQFDYYGLWRLYGRSVGETMVYAYLAEMPDVRDSCLVRVLPIEGESIVMNEKAVELYVEEKAQLMARVYPENATYQELAWSSSDEDVATVDETGLVTALAAGETVIMAETTDGLQAECRVRVLPASITLSETEMELFVDETQVLKVEVHPDNEKYRELTWSSSDEAVAAVNADGVVTALSAGDAVITVVSAGGMEATCKVKVKNVLVSSVAIPELEGGKTLVLGKELQLTSMVLPGNAFNRNVVIRSSNEQVAYVDENNVLHANAYGETLVTVESEDGNAYQSYNVKVRYITHFLDASRGKSSFNIGGVSWETVGSTLKNNSEYTIEVVSVVAYQGDKIIQYGGQDMWGPLKPGEDRSFDLTADKWADIPSFKWIIEFDGMLYDVLGGIKIND